MQEFVYGLSVLVRGSLEEKLHWAFSLYDINGDGIITMDEMTSIVTAIYAMMGRHTEPVIDVSTPRQHAETVFRVSIFLFSNPDYDDTADSFIDKITFLILVFRQWIWTETALFH
jgi:hypothetical protein